MGTAALGQGMAGGADARHEQGGLAAGAHGNGGSGLGRRGSGSGRQYWCRERLGQWGLCSWQWKLRGGKGRGEGGWDEDECPPLPFSFYKAVRKVAEEPRGPISLQ